MACIVTRWLGEHVNQVCGSSAWKAVGKGPIELPTWVAPPSDPSECMALAAATHCPMLVAVISHLQRVLLSGQLSRCLLLLPSLGALHGLTLLNIAFSISFGEL
jgi:hypothetical protein